MSTPLQVMILEDQQADAELMANVLRQAGFAVDCQRVETVQDFLDHLNADLDLILADYKLPQFSALEALQLLKGSGFDIPLIVITGTASEESAVECMKEGAHDYLLKDRLARLAQTVSRALEQRELRAAKLNAEAALRRSEELNRAVLQSLFEHIAVLDHDGTITIVNDAWTNFAVANGDPTLARTGVGTNYLAVCREAADAGDEYARKALVGIEAVLSGAQISFSLEYPCHSPAQQRWFVMNVAPLDRASGGVTISHTSISERKFAEEAVASSEKRFRALVEKSADGIVLLNAEGKVIYQTPAVSRMNGYPTETRIGGNLHDLVAPDMQGSVGGLFAQLLQTPGGTATSQIRIRRKDESERWLDITATNMLDEPAVEAIVVNLRDITERKQAEEALERERRMLRTLIDTLPDYIYVKDVQSRFVIANLAQARLLGAATPEELFGKTDKDFLPDDLAEQYYRNDQEVIRTGLPMINYQEPGVDPSGGRRWHLTSQVPFCDEQGNIQGLVGVTRDITEQKRVEEELRKLSRAVEQSPNGLLIADPQAHIEYVNPRFSQITGYTSDEVVGKNPHLLASGSTTVATYQQLWETVLAGGEWQGELQERKKDGEIFWVSISIAPITDLDGRTTHFLAVYEDITNRKELDEALRMSEIAEREQRIFAEALREMTTALVSILNPDRVMDQILETIGRVVPHDSANIMVLEGSKVRIAYSRGWPPQVAAAYDKLHIRLDMLPNLQQMLVTGNPCLIPDVDTQPGWVNLEVPERMPIRSFVGCPIKSHRQTIGFINLDSKAPGFFTPAHADRLRAFADHAAIAIENAQLYDEIRLYAGNLERHVEERTAELQQVKDRIEAIFNSSSDAIIVARIDGSILQVNPAFIEMFIDEAERISGQSIENFIQGSYRDTFMQELHEVRHDYQRKRIEFVARRADGSLFDAEAALSSIITRNQRTLEIESFDIVCIIRDITERKRVEKELKELNQLKNEFLSTAAHELRTPLTAIRGFSEILLTRQIDQDRQRRYMTMINDQSTELGQLIDDLLDISRLEAKRSLSLVFEPVNMVDLIDKSLGPFRESVKIHTIATKFPSGCPLIVGDVVRLSQVVKNLVSNAIKYSPQGGAILVQLQQVPNYLHISVRDEGIGMTSDQLAHLFEKFYRANASNTDVSGTGLGLAISKLIIEMHGGEILADSEYGVGTTVCFTLPLSADHIRS